ncbi:MAG: putative membrane protein YfcA [Rickettsiales bacterium]|jgi:uncharacterized membrane protein YfcA
MIILGFLLAALMGSTLGLIGAGGSILTVPILVYFLQIPPSIATAYSLLIVGITALVGALFYYKKGLIDIRSMIIFAFPAMIFVLIARIFVIPNLPQTIFNVPKEMFIMLLFALLMLVAAFLMLRDNPNKNKNPQEKSRVLLFLKLVLGSSVVGFLTGMIGAGGGFLIIPTLIVLFGLEMQKAIGTSLAIIAINSLIGFNGDLILGTKMDWNILAPFITLTIIGMFGGLWVSKYFDGQKLKKIFASFILIMAIAIFVQEIG